MSSVFDEPESAAEGPGCLSFVTALGCAVPGFWIVIAFAMARLEIVGAACAGLIGLTAVRYARKRSQGRRIRILLAVIAAGPAVIAGVMCAVVLGRS